VTRIEERTIFGTQGEVRIYNHCLADISKARPLNGEGYRIFHYLLGKITKDNTVPGPSATARDMELERSHVSRAYQQMLSDGYIVKHDDVWSVHPFIAYYGTEGRRAQAIQKLSFNLIRE